MVGVKKLHRFWLPILIILPVMVLGIFPINPRPVELTNAWQRARLAEAASRPADAAQSYQQVLIFMPERTDLLVRIADLEFAAGNFNQSITSYQTVIQHGSMTAQGWLNLGDAFQKIGNLPDAVEAWSRLEDLPSATAIELEGAAERLRAEGDLSATLEIARRWQTLDPESTQAAWLTGMLLAPQDLTESARALAAAANGTEPESEMARSLLETLGQAALQTDQAYRLMLIGQRLADLGQWDAAEPAFAAATRASPKYAEAWALLGETRQHLGKEGWNELLRAKMLSPNSDMVLSALSLYWNRVGKPKIALSYLEKLAANHPDQGKWQMEMGNTQAQMGDLVKAMAAYQQAVVIQPDDAAMWRSLAIFSSTYGFDFATFSKPAIDQALSLAPQDATVLDAAGWVYFTNSDLKSAEQFLQQALAKDGELAAAKLHLAQVFLAGNHFSQALPLLKSAANQTNDPSTAAQALRLLGKNFPGQ